MIVRRLSLPLAQFNQINSTELQEKLREILNGLRLLRESLLTKNHAFTWENLLEPIEAAEDERLHAVWLPIHHLSTVAKTDELNEAAEACEQMIVEYNTEKNQNEKWYRAVKSILVNETYFCSLDLFQQQAVKKIIASCEKSGVHLSESSKALFMQMQKELSKLSNNFEENVRHATKNGFVYWPANGDVSGIPESILAVARNNAKMKDVDGYLFGLDESVVHVVSTNAQDRGLREAVYKARMTRAQELNYDVMSEMLRKRNVIAKLFGFANYAEYSAQNQMCSLDAAKSLLSKLQIAGKAQAEAEFAALSQFARDKLNMVNLQAWDVGYASEKFQEEQFDFSEEDLRPYFSAPCVMNELFQVANRLYGVTFEREADADVWHNDVKFYKIYDKQGQLIAGIYFDLFERENKNPEAWMAEIQYRRQLPSGEIQLPIACVNCDFEQSSASNKPALWLHSNVVDLFHETGHAFQHVFSRSTVASVCGIMAVPEDAIELASMYFEKFAEDPAAVKEFAKHYETSEPIPDQLFDAMKRAQYFQSAMGLMNQLEIAYYDLNLHATAVSNPDFDFIRQSIIDARQLASVMPRPEWSRWEASFRHLFVGGYEAKYYSYVLSNVLGADLYESANPEAVEKTFLTFGGCRPQLDMFFECTGRRDFSVEPFLLQNGMDVATQKQSAKRRSRDNQFNPGLFQNACQHVDEKSSVSASAASNPFF